MISFFDRLQSLKRRHPRLWLLVRHPGIFVERMFYRVALLPFWRRQKPGSTAENPHLVQRTGEYNAAAERYFADFPDRQFLLDKPFSDAEGFPDHLIRAGTLMAHHYIVVKNGARELVDNDWLRAGLERDLKPEDRVVVKIDTPAIDCPGTYEVEFDIVLENVTWFARRGSPTATLNITVE